MILAGDIGGTNCRLALFDESLELVTEKTYASRDFHDFVSVVKAFKETLATPVEAACFGIPGPGGSSCRRCLPPIS